jgi:hypothetical protein
VQFAVSPAAFPGNEGRSKDRFFPAKIIQMKTNWIFGYLLVHIWFVQMASVAGYFYPRNEPTDLAVRHRLRPLVHRLQNQVCLFSFFCGPPQNLRGG